MKHAATPSKYPPQTSTSARVATAYRGGISAAQSSGMRARKVPAPRRWERTLTGCPSQSFKLDNSNPRWIYRGGGVSAGGRTRVVVQIRPAGETLGRRRTLRSELVRNVSSWTGPEQVVSGVTYRYPVRIWPAPSLPVRVSPAAQINTKSPFNSLLPRSYRGNSQHRPQTYRQTPIPFLTRGHGRSTHQAPPTATASSSPSSPCLHPLLSSPPGRHPPSSAHAPPARS